MKNTLKFMLVLGNAKMIMTEENGKNLFYSRAKLTPAGRKTDLKKFAACLSARI